MNLRLRKQPRQRQRPCSSLPVWLLGGLLLALALQTGSHQWMEGQRKVSEQQLTPPLNPAVYKLLSLGSEKLMSYLLILRLQLHDNQLGRNLRYRHLDYHALSQWLLMLYQMNPKSDYPAFLASRVYSQVRDPRKVRQMVSVIETLFDQNPQQHWRRMTEASVLAKHILKDLPLALRLADKVADLPAQVQIPYWARDMKLVLLDELNELETAQLLISSMLQQGQISDPDEIRFLQSRLLKIQQKLSAQRQKIR